MKKVIKRLLACLLAITVLVTSVPVSANDDTSDTDSDKVYHTITFNAMGGSFSDGADTFTLKVVDNEYTTVTPETPTRDGWYFVGWTSTESDGGIQENPASSSVSISGSWKNDIVYYAKYRYAIKYTVVDHFLDSDLNEVATKTRGTVSAPKNLGLNNYASGADRLPLGGVFNPKQMGILWVRRNTLAEDRFDEYNSLGLPVDASNIGNSYLLYRYNVDGKWKYGNEEKTHAEGIYSADGAGSLYSVETTMGCSLLEDTQIDYYYWLIPQTKLTVTNHFGKLDKDNNFIETDKSVEEVKIDNPEANKYSTSRSPWATTLRLFQ